MPFNLVHSLVHRVEDGWDPISSDYANQYAESAWREDCAAVINRLEAFGGRLKGKKVLDLGGGAGQYSVLFAQRGAFVTWHDVSREYARIARNKAESSGVSVEFSLGYLESAVKQETQSFDVVFCRLSWSYGKNDRNFARLLWSLIGPGGVGYIECNTPAFARPRGLTRVRYWLNEYLWWKIGHPYPPHGRIAKLIQAHPVKKMIVDYSSEFSDIVMFVKRS
jgi:2-polyprenyl-3-methyl-5-hydroxy-6-metoxy-1,4-benzoquinol methylase